MKLIKQGESECLLASICMIADTPIEVARTLVPKQYGSWKSFIRSQNDKEISLILQCICPKIPFGFGLFEVEAFIPLPEYAINLSKRGVLVVGVEDPVRGYAAHAVAFEQGTIYNPHGFVYGWEDFITQYAHDLQTHPNDIFICGIVYA